MNIIAKLRYLRIAPRKVRLVADLIRGKKIEEAQSILHFALKRTAEPLFKLLKSAVANAKNNSPSLDEENLYISKIMVDEGPKYKRWMPRARGQAYRIQKKTSHITLVLEEIIKESKKIKKMKRVKKPEIEKSEKIPRVEKPKARAELEIAKPKIEKGIKRVFRRKAF